MRRGEAAEGGPGGGAGMAARRRDASPPTCRYGGAYGGAAALRIILKRINAPGISHAGVIAATGPAKPLVQAGAIRRRQVLQGARCPL